MTDIAIDAATSATTSAISKVSKNPGLWELNLVEFVAQILSKALTDEEAERVVKKLRSIQERIRELSTENLRKLQPNNPTSPNDTTSLCQHKQSCTSNAIRGFLKGFIVSYGVKYAVGFLPALLTGRLRKNPSLLKSIGGKDTIRFALFISSFISSYKALLCLFRNWTKSSSPWNAFFAGSLSGLTLLVDSNRSRRISIALYLTTRTVHFFARYLWRVYIAKNVRAVMGKWTSSKNDLEGETDGVLSTSTSNTSAEESESEDDALMMKPLDDMKVDSKMDLDNDNNNDDDVEDIVDDEAVVDRQSNKTLRSVFPAKSTLRRPDHLPPTLIARNKPLALMASPPLKPTTLSKDTTLATTTKSKPDVEVEVAGPHQKVDDHHKGILKRFFSPLLMSIASTQILYALVLQPKTLPPPYLAFLFKHSGLKGSHGAKSSRQVFPLLRQLVENAENGVDVTRADADMTNASQEIIDNIDMFKSIGQYNSDATYHGCAVQHFWCNSCYGFVGHVFMDEAKRALELYGSLNLLMVLLFRPGKIFKQPLSTLLSYLKTTARSTLFLTIYVTIVWATPCFSRNLFGTERRLGYYMNGAMAGLAVMLESPGRQLELAYYCLPRAMESLWREGITRGYWKPLQIYKALGMAGAQKGSGGEVGFFVLATGVLMALYQMERGDVSGVYRKMLTRLFGVN